MSGRNGIVRRASLCLVVVLACVVGFADVASASPAEAPAWALTVVPTPTNLVPESPRSETDRLVVDATGGTFRLSEGEYTGVFYTRALAYNASPVEVEGAINVMNGKSGGGTVTVTGGPGGTAPYTIVWGGSAANYSLKSLGIESLTVESTRLTGANHMAAISPVTVGVRPAELVITATNVSNTPTDGSKITLRDVLPPGLTATEVIGIDPYKEIFPSGAVSCSTTPAPTCSYEGVIDPGGSLIARIKVAVAGGLSGGLEDVANVSGGGAEASTTSTLPVGAAPASFGAAPGSIVARMSTMQAGAHPDLTTSFAFATGEATEPSAAPKDIRFDLPPGLVGNTVGLPRCSMHRVLEEVENAKACPSDAMVGMATITISYATPSFAQVLVVPIYNIAPAPGEPAAFGFDALLFPVRLDTSLLSNGSYGVRVTSPDLSEGAPPIGSSITIWGVPADHNGPGRDQSAYDVLAGESSFGGPSGATRVPLLTAPQQCSESLSGRLETDSWAEPGHFVPSETVSLGTPTGCDQLRLVPSFSMVPDTLEAGAPAGYNFDLRAAQNTSPDGLATPNVKDVSLTLPVGTVVNPSAAWGLRACSNSQFYGPDHPSQAPASPAACPREAQIGTVRVKTPALEEALEGQVYLGTPECDPCSPQDAEDGRMVRLFVQFVSEGEGGLVVKLEGHGHIDQQTGQITTVFDENPQLPFSEFKLTLGGGPRAVLANPRACGPATTTMDLTPWSTPFTPDATPAYTFEVNQDCFGAQFAPTFAAGSTNIQAGQYTPFTVAFGRSDQDEFLGSITQTMPAGLVGNIGAITLCKEPQAAQGTCPAASLIGHVKVLTGPGVDPFFVDGGQVFLTEGYRGAQYGLSIVVPAVAGPYTLSGTTGKGTVVVRAKIVVDPVDAQLTVVSDPLPSVLDGIPLQLKAVNVTIDRPGFTLNPTSCSKMAVAATLSSTEGLSAAVSSPFQVTNCTVLGFKPGFSVATSGRNSRVSGASLHVKLTYPKGSFGTEANIKSVKVDLPKQLPSRLETLKKACIDRVFAQDPAACPAASRIGMAKATTPILPVSLEGPVYFVSHGGAKFPELVIVLSGYGVTVQLHSETFINEKTGITSSTFRAIPDVPVGTFELTLPQGRLSALAANTNLCNVKGGLHMPTAFTAQNGATIHQETPIAVAGCPRHKAHRAGRSSRQNKRNKEVA